jgi:hypothetical protein
VIDFCLLILTALDEYIVFANRRTCLSDSHRRTDIHNGNIDRDTRQYVYENYTWPSSTPQLSERPGIAT